MPESFDRPASHPPKPLSFADLKIGSEYWSVPYAFTKDGVVAFAREWDPQAYHIDDAAAENSIFGRLSVSGIHTLAVSQRVFNDLGLFRGIGLAGIGIENLRWRRPVYPDDTVRVRGLVQSITPSGDGRAVVSIATEVLNQEDVVALRYDLLVLVRTDL